MTNQITPSVTTPTIADIYQNIESTKLVLRPDFQRRFVWTHEHQEDFIDTILNGYPFPEIYVCQGSIDIKKLKTTQHVIDGQQRLTTIRNYIEHTFKHSLKKVQPFEKLNDKDKNAFLSYKVVFRDIGEVDDDTIKEIFRRINLTKFKLEDIEIHNAIYDGEFIQTAKEIASDIPLKEFGVFHESEFTRMADTHFILSIMACIEIGGYFAKDTEIEKHIIKYNDEYPNSSYVKAALIQTFAIIKDLKLPKDSLWFRKSAFYTLVVEISRNLELQDDGFKERLVKLEKTLSKNKDKGKENKFGIFYDYMYQGTTARKARIVRANVFKEEVFGIKSP